MNAIERLRAIPTPHADATPAQRALWFDLHGDWKAAHAEVEEPGCADECLVHAYLHRVEGDQSNAAYWYRRASAPVCRLTLDGERDALAERLFG